MIEDFTKVKMVEMPRNIVAGHGVLECVRDMCEGIHTGRVGTIVTGTRTMDAAAKAVLGYMDGYDMDVVQVGEATIDNARLVEERIREFAGEGHRFYDARRMGDIIEMQGYEPFDIAKFVFPIPADEINAGFCGPQNENWSDGLPTRG